MPTLTPREQRTLRLAAIAIGIYLALFFGMRIWKQLEAKRCEYEQLRSMPGG